MKSFFINIGSSFGGRFSSRAESSEGYYLAIGITIFVFILLGAGLLLLALALRLFGIDSDQLINTIIARADRPGGFGDMVVYVISRGLLMLVIIIPFTVVGFFLVWEGITGIKAAFFGSVAKTLGGLLMLYFIWIGIKELWPSTQ